MSNTDARVVEKLIHVGRSFCGERLCLLPANCWRKRRRAIGRTMIAGEALVTGASGFLGGHLANRLATEGQSVRALVRQASDVSRLVDREGGSNCLR